MKRLLVATMVTGLLTTASPALARRDDGDKDRDRRSGCSERDWRIVIERDLFRLCLFRK